MTSILYILFSTSKQNLNLVFIIPYIASKLILMNNALSDIKSIERAFYSDGFRLGTIAAKKLKSGSLFFDEIKEMYQLLDSMIDSFSSFATQQKQKIDCKKGCSWCCHQPVFAMDYELDYLNAFIKKNFTESKLNIVREKARIKNEKLDTLENEALLNSKFPCPLLEDGACIAYEARPVACRIYLSKNVNSCIHFYNIPEDKTSFPELLDLPMRVGRMTNEGFKAALKTSGLKPAEFRIDEKLL